MRACAGRQLSSTAAATARYIPCCQGLRNFSFAPYSTTKTHSELELLGVTERHVPLRVLRDLDGRGTIGWCKPAPSRVRGAVPIEFGDLLHVILRFLILRNAVAARYRTFARVVRGERQGHVTVKVFQQLLQVPHAAIDVLLRIVRVSHLE